MRRGLGDLIESQQVASRLVPLTSQQINASNAAYVPAVGEPKPYIDYGGITKQPQIEVPTRQSWWLDPPLGFRPFDIQVGAAVPAPAAETTILSYLADDAFGGVVKGIVMCYVGTGFVDGSGDLTWSVQINGNPHDGYGLVTVALGSPQFQELVQGGIIFQPRDLITITLTNTNAALATGRTVARITGYKVPLSVIGPDYRG